MKVNTHIDPAQSVPVRVLQKNFSRKNLQSVYFAGADLSHANFHGSDLRGANFTGANLTGADLTKVRTGVTPFFTALIFFGMIVISMFSGYMAMLAGGVVQTMLVSSDIHVRTAGMVTVGIISIFIGFSVWRGVGNAMRMLLLPASVAVCVVGVAAYLSGRGTGIAMAYVIISFFLVVIMFIVGTVSRAVAGAVSNVLFLIVALAGGLFSRTLGGGIGPLIMAISCAAISKRALSGVRGFDPLRRITCYVTKWFGTSFRNATLTMTNFSGSSIHNADFSNANRTFVHWGDCKKMNCRE